MKKVLRLFLRLLVKGKTKGGSFFLRVPISFSCHVASLYVQLTCKHISCKIKMFRRKLNWVQNFCTKNCIDFHRVEAQIIVSFSIFLHETLLACFWRENFKGSHFEFFAQKVARGNAVQMFYNFPAKSLSI